MSYLHYLMQYIDVSEYIILYRIFQEGFLLQSQEYNTMNANIANRFGSMNSTAILNTDTLPQFKSVLKIKSHFS